MPTRRNVWNLDSGWNDTILWYAKGVDALKKRPLKDPASWRFFAAMHGIQKAFWTQDGYYQNGEDPSPAVVEKYWDQCQHGSWYFLPWHRGYLLAFERLIRSAAGAPADWALPYWDYFKDGQAALPEVFASKTWPGAGQNPLYVSQRWGPAGDGDVYVDLDVVNLEGLDQNHFSGSALDPGFGGQVTGFEHSGGVHGGVETQPHDYVHGVVGGPCPQNLKAERHNRGGLMSDPRTAALDPIFWLHHANIDRLWEVWRGLSETNTEPTDAEFLAGPSDPERIFVMPNPDGSEWAYTPAGMLKLAPLGYDYEDVNAKAKVASVRARIAALRPDVSVTAGSQPMSNDKEPELVGATPPNRIAVAGKEISAPVRLDPAVRKTVTASLKHASVADPPDKLLLNLENVRSNVDSPAFHVWVDGPGGVSEKVGSIALFGAGRASDPKEKHGGAGLTFVLDISKLFDQLHLKGELDADELHVRLVAVHPIPQEADVSIERMSIYRKPGK